MAKRITNEILEAYLNCKTKGYLKLIGETGTKSDYEAMTEAACRASRELFLTGIVARYGEGNVYRGAAIIGARLTQGEPLLADAVIEDDGISILFDALKRADGASMLGGHHFVPVLHNHGDKVGRSRMLLLAALGLAIARVQGLRPIAGLVVRGPEGRFVKVCLHSKLYRQAEQVLEEVKRLQAGGEPPRLTLNKHCPVCEFRQRCCSQAEKEDDLSLLRGMSEQEIKRQNGKGIFTVRQLSYTFRVRRRNMRAKRQAFPRSFALQALAIRENRIHVHGSYDIPHSPTSIYLDIEGLPDQDFYYLIGLLVVENGVESHHSFWADSEEDQLPLFAGLLERLGQFPEYRLFHFGDYETKALRRIRSRLTGEQQEQVDKIGSSGGSVRWA